jgi:hypothetical protein
MESLLPNECGGNIDPNECDGGCVLLLLVVLLSRRLHVHS